jgi:hypothetical protein
VHCRPDSELIPCMSWASSPDKPMAYWGWRSMPDSTADGGTATTASPASLVTPRAALCPRSGAGSTGPDGRGLADTTSVPGQAGSVEARRGRNSVDAREQAPGRTCRPPPASGGRVSAGC